jgi:predicted dehydrogenase
MERRSFLVTAATAAASARAWGANDRVNVAIVGLGGRGTAHLNAYLGLPDVRVAALVEVDSGRLEKAETTVYNKTQEKPKGYRDMREAFADKNVDAVSMPLPNHWHSLATIWAVQAGKDVYCEKPASHNIWEGRKMVEAARKYGRMVQIGSQSRSTPHKMEAMKLLQDGVIGKLYLAKGLCFKRRKSIGHTPEEPVPAGLDWEKFLGPAPLRAFTKNRFNYNWHWFWDTGNGDIGNQGVHEMDIARWGMGVDYPASVVSTGGKYVYDDDQETPNTQMALYDYGDKQIQFEVRGLITHDHAIIPSKRNTVGNLFYGADGYMSVDDDGYRIYKGEDRALFKEGKAERGGPSTTALHMQNFLNACRTRKHTDLSADIEVGHISAALCHMANISYRLGGAKLNFDSKTEWFDNAAANQLATREYRKPYVVPAKV